jgi:hypothetical protein
MSAVLKNEIARKPRLCFVGFDNLAVLAREYNHLYAGGEPVQQTLLALAFARRGYPVSMVVADHGQPDGAEWHGVRTYKAYRSSDGMPVVRFIHPRWTGLWSALKRANADVYYTSCSGMQVGQIALFCRQHGRKFIFRSASDADCTPDLPLVRYWRDKQLYAFGLKRADAVLTQSDKQRMSMRRHFGVDSSVANMLVDYGAVRPYADRDIDMLWVSNLRGLKRPELFLELSHRLPTLQSHMVGGPMSAERSLYDSMERRAADLPQMHFHGRVAYHDSHAFYERARVLINTSDIEGFPNTYLQAWSRGVPVVSFFDPDRIIEREGLGHVARDLADMQAAAARLAHDETAWRSASQRCLAYMERHFGEAQVLSVYEHAIARALGTAT